jgi:hypothetical protein
MTMEVIGQPSDQIEMPSGRKIPNQVIIDDLVLQHIYIYMAFRFVSLNSYPIYTSTREKDMYLNHSSSRDEHNETHLPSTLTPSHLSPPGNTRASDDRILTVDWDGPDDPENPRK